MYALKIALDICSLIAAFGSVLLFALPYLRYRYAILKHFILLQAAFSFYFLNDLVRVILTVNGAMVFIFRFISFSAYVVWFIPFFLFVPRFFHSLVAIPFAGIARIASIIAGAIQVPILVLPWAIHRDAESAYELMVRLVRAVDNSLFVVMTLYLIVLLFIARRNEKRDPLIVRIIKVLPVYTAIFLPGFAYEVLITHSSQDYQAPQPFIFVRLYYASVTVACIIQFLQYYAKRAEALQSLLARYSSDQEYAKSNKYRKSNLAEEESRELFGRLRKMIEDERLYADTDITPSELAALLGISIHKLSQSINENAGCGFYDFMNGFRVEEVKRRLASSSHDSANLLDLAFEAGFSSKSTFNAAFKKLTGLTPSAYKASLG